MKEKKRFRDAKSGEFITETEAEASPETTVAESYPAMKSPQITVACGRCGELETALREIIEHAKIEFESGGTVSAAGFKSIAETALEGAENGRT